MPQPCRVTTFDSNPVAYNVAYEWQRLLLSARRDNVICDTLLLLEHEPVITIGKGSRDRADLLTGAAQLASRGIDLVETDRGGEMTYHAPGQLVGYPILDLDLHGRDLHRYLRGLEEAIILAIAEFGVNAGRKEGLTGVWVGDSKICAIGVKVSRWITMHGFALNVSPDMTPFRRDFVPCGIHDKGVVSLAELGGDVGIRDVQEACARALARVFGMERFDFPEADMRALLANLLMVYSKHEGARQAECGGE